LQAKNGGVGGEERESRGGKGGTARWNVSISRKVWGEAADEVVDVLPELGAALGFLMNDANSFQGSGSISGRKSRSVDPTGGPIAEKVNQGGGSGNIAS
jgi:hypothetical protein